MNALYLVNKPSGISSFGVIRELRKIHKSRKLGHAGTLDPFATGLLIVGRGQYTRLLQYAEALDKSYIATLSLGTSTATGDPEGEILGRAALPETEPDFAALRAKALALTELPLPRYSAVKINGVRAYHYARKGIELELPLRALKIYELEILDYDGSSLKYRARVSKGTYIRAISEWLAAELGTLGYTSELFRASIGSFCSKDACPWEARELIDSYRIQPRSLLTDFSEYHASAAEQKQLLQGNSIPVAPELPEGEYAIYSQAGELIALAHKSAAAFKPRQVFSLS
ncbi:MAG: tRNA pseudouridine(55) synthase TruB [Candidatus Cloacimonetes bacterium]|nr:tRNA pseudouridine(55) synthase TruB [Candidatus Cloacimonadota bacterium]